MQSLKSSKGSSSLSFLRNKSGLHHQSVTQSTPTSRSTSAVGVSSTQQGISTSTPAGTLAKEKTLVQSNAIRIPLIHLLATRPLSSKYLAQKLNCSREVIDQALEKVGRPARGDPEKKELNDKTYKDLDVWAFNYPDNYDRDNAIQRSIAAFDRMRMSQEDPRWQMLYTKEERHKGITLSRLNHLAKGAIQQSSTPRIHVQQPEDSVDEKLLKESSGESDQKGHLTPKSSEPMARSKSGDQIKKKKVSEKEAQAKRLLSNGPKKMKAETKAKESHPAVKKGGSKKGPIAKSEEFVHESDEEDGLADSMAIDAQKSPSTKAINPVSPSPADVSPVLKAVGSKISKKTVPSQSTLPKPIKHESNVKVSKPAKSTKPAKPVHVVQASFPNLKTASTSDAKQTKEEEAKKRAEAKVPHKRIPSSPAATPGAKARISEAASQQGPTAMQKSLSRNRNGSSPHKPSPLGSSPPTNASEFGSHNHKNNITPPSSASSSVKKNSTHPVNGHNRNVSAESKPKSNGHNHHQQQQTHARHPSSSSSSLSSDATLKRKANDLDNGIHNHQTSSTPLSNGLSPYTDNKTAKRLKKMSSSTAEEEDERRRGEATDESSTSPLSEHELKLLEAQRFKTLHAKYEKAYREVMDCDGSNSSGGGGGGEGDGVAVSPEQVALVRKMHVRLEEMKRSIIANKSGGVVGGRRFLS